MFAGFHQCLQYRFGGYYKSMWNPRSSPARRQNLGTLPTGTDLQMPDMGKWPSWSWRPHFCGRKSTCLLGLDLENRHFLGCQAWKIHENPSNSHRLSTICWILWMNGCLVENWAAWWAAWWFLHGNLVGPQGLRKVGQYERRIGTLALSEWC
jgi:hypothetical protein